MTPSQILSLAVVGVDFLIVLVLIPRVVIQRRESAATLAWMLLILVVPILGALLYAVLGVQRLRRRRTRRRRARRRLDASAAALRSELAPFRLVSPGSSALASLARSYCVDLEATTSGNEVTIYHDGEMAFQALCEAVGQAQRYVHLEYYIFQDDSTGRALLSLLTERAGAGVEIRLLVDAVGSWKLRHSVLAALQEAGGRFAEFLPVTILRRPFSVNLRNHRKIVVIDGQTAFTGGMNIGDEYRSRNPEIGHWRDTHARVRGPAALRLQEIFAEDWHFATGEDCMLEPRTVHVEPRGDVLVEVLESGPDRTAETIYYRIFVAITRAEKRVWLTTPYFIPDRAIFVALVTAAQRGVDVRLLLPSWSDHKFVLYAGRAYYQELLQAGVRIFEYGPGMLHAKTMVVDDTWVTIGSANMDRRSFHLNWEANLILLDPDIAAAMASRFERDLVRARSVEAPYRPSLPKRFGESVCFLLAPLL
ncbi:MAG: cardiolipin synthase [Myxococcales bacterium]|nr:cardiolipin synthase [Polyangiaceae bacterium]MDW8248597.1 cardiolipin synthase [Myxococcales bacterium]